MSTGVPIPWARACLPALLSFVVAGSVCPGCGTDARESYDADASAGASSGATPGASGGSGIDPSKQLEAGPRETIGTLHGKVVAPEGTVPIMNALVYLTSRVPEPIPEHSYCDTCVQLTPNEPYTYSKPDGTFDLPAYAAGTQYLVVQKGQFRRVRALDVAAGEQDVAADFSRLPGKNDLAAGDTIPKIAMVLGGYDKIDFSLQKLGIEEFYRYGDSGPAIGGTPPGIKTGKTKNALTTSAEELAQYHIALMPCAAMGMSQDGEGGFTCYGPQASEKDAFRGYVEGGGKLYVTDFAYEAVRQTWPDLITFYDDTMEPMPGTGGTMGGACRGGAETTEGTVEDSALGQWMDAIGETDIELHASWSRIASVQSAPGLDETGQPTTIVPKVWMSSTVGDRQLPATVSFEQQCGRVLFSTYHTEGDSGSALLAQEKALLFILLEVGVCVGQLPPGQVN